jgi:cysteine synthase A
MIDECIYVTDLDCIVGCRRLVEREAILAGGSSGGVLMAVERSRPRIPRGATCVVLLADHGNRYLDTVYSDAWVEEHFGAVSHLWKDPNNDDNDRNRARKERQTEKQENG